jgi:hypothetical protein
MGGLLSIAYIEELGNGSSPDPYFNHISTLVTIDTPHGGSVLAFLQKIDYGACWSGQDTLNKRQMQPSGPDSIIPTVNYFAAGATALPAGLKAYSIVSYWTISTPLGKLLGVDKYTDNVLLFGEQDLSSNLNNPAQNAKSKLVRVKNIFGALFDLCGSIHYPPYLLHSMDCTGSAGQTTSLIKSEIRGPAVMTQDVVVSPSTATTEQGGSIQLTAKTPSKQAAIWSLLEGREAGSINANGVYIPGSITGTFHAVAIDSVGFNDYGMSTITVTPNNGDVVVTTLAATSLTASGAVLNGTINPQGANGEAGFYWGTDPTMGTYSAQCYFYNPPTCPVVTANFTTQSFAYQLTGLASNTTYYFRMVFYDTDNGKFRYGAITSFKTKDPMVTTLAATSLTASGAVLNGTINPQGANGEAGFYWGTDPTMGTYSAQCYFYNPPTCPVVTANFTTQSFAYQLTGLASNTTYYFRMVFYDTDNGKFRYGAITSFTTQ